MPELHNIFNFTFQEFYTEIAKLTNKSFVAKQIWNWIYIKKISNFDEMTNISKTLREDLKNHFLIQNLIVTKDLISKDETRKWLFKLKNNQEIETVFIPEGNRGTLCISSQIGCTLTCKFCHTGTQLLVRNLELSEIIGQFMTAQKLLKKEISNIVFMGMGEPFYNYENVVKSIEVFNDPSGIKISRRKITVSTSGVIPQIIKFSDNVRASLAISFHSSNNDIRSRIMPINKKYPISELINACIYYQEKNPKQRITFEYVMLKNTNDSKQDAQDLIEIILKNKLDVFVNIIPFNSWKSCEFEQSNQEKINAFAREIKNANIDCSVRKTKGEDIMAACGQLKSDTESIG
jgi:23S rRNA (adenine2503-C2)-methyltransferase